MIADRLAPPPPLRPWNAEGLARRRIDRPALPAPRPRAPLSVRARAARGPPAPARRPAAEARTRALAARAARQVGASAPAADLDDDPGAGRGRPARGRHGRLPRPPASPGAAGGGGLLPSAGRRGAPGRLPAGLARRPRRADRGRDGPLPPRPRAATASSTTRPGPRGPRSRCSRPRIATGSARRSAICCCSTRGRWPGRPRRPRTPRGGPSASSSPPA